MDGALALAVPTKAGQSMEIVHAENESAHIHWKSLDAQGEIWFSASFDGSFNILETTHAQMAETLKNVLVNAKSLNAQFASEGPVKVTTRLEFPLEWGLGSSSTLLSNLAAWANVDPYALFFKTFKGSGYDIACAHASQPVFYRLNKSEPYCESVEFNPPFLHQLYFIYLNRKKNSREAITYYEKKKVITPEITGKISHISKAAASAQTLEEFASLMREHEALVSARLSMFNVQDLYFRDFAGTIKSLGAWGGDFIMAASKSEPRYIEQYFKNKGFNVIIPFQNLVLNGQAIEN